MNTFGMKLGSLTLAFLFSMFVVICFPSIRLQSVDAATPLCNNTQDPNSPPGCSQTPVCPSGKYYIPSQDPKKPDEACVPPPCDNQNPDYDNPDCVKQTFKSVSGGFDFGNANSFKDVGKTIIDTAGGIILGVAVLKIIFGGIMYSTAAGNPQRIEEAKSHIYYALIGVALLVGMNILLFLIGAQTY